MCSLRPDTLTWTALLGRWIEFAQASVALPRDGEGGRWRDSVVSVITLQAVCFALAEVDELAADERALALDKAELLISDHARQLQCVWEGEEPPDALGELVEDARLALDAAGRVLEGDVVELVWGGDEPMVMPALEHGASQSGSLAVAAPGTIVMPGEPVAWWSGRPALALAGCGLQYVPRPRQIYRQIDGNGRIVRDVVSTIDADVAAGMPLLVPLLAAGRPVGRFLMDAVDWEKRQRASMDAETIPVETRA